MVELRAELAGDQLKPKFIFESTEEDPKTTKLFSIC